MTLNHRSSLGLMGLLPALFFFAACDQGAPPTEQGSAPQVAEATAEVYCANHALYRCPLDSLRLLFNSRFCTGPKEACLPLATADVVVDPAALGQIVASLPWGPDTLHGVWFQYGLGTRSEFQVGIRVLPLVPDTGGWYTMDTTGTAFYTVKPDGTLTTSSYAAFASGAEKAYLQNMRVRRTPGGVPEPLDPAGMNDRTSYLMPWECVLEALYAENQDAIDDGAELVVASIAMDQQEGNDPANDLRHHLALFLRNDSILVNDTVYAGQPFHRKAADHGTACPPMCTSFRYSTTPAPTCK
jgi:hypothetical protein